MKPGFDIAVIGAGSGGLTVAAAAARFGQRVILFEKGEMGGDCLNYGCVPSKALLAAAKQARAMRSGEAYGIAPVEPQVDFAKVMAHVRRAIAAIAPHDSRERFEKLGVTVIRASAHFIDGAAVEAKGQRYTARRIVIATGSRPAAPPIPGLDHVFHFTNETIFANDVLPRHLVIIGGGPIGLEMAQAHRRLGSEVTVIEAALPLARDDPEAAAAVLSALKREGVRILPETKVKAVTHGEQGIAAETDLHGTVAGSHLLVAAGRLPNVEALNLAAAGVAFTAKGITVDAGLKTTNPKIYAIGDVAGGPQFTHMAGYHGGLVIRNALFGLPVSASAAVPWVTYTDPELAHVGLTETQARLRHGVRIKVLIWPFESNDRAQAEGSSEGFVKVVTSGSGHVLGACIVGRQAGELIQPWVLALSRGLKIGAMAALVLPYPTRGEAGRGAALSYYADFPSRPWVRRVISLVRALRP